jgi:hypothetical protein
MAMEEVEEFVQLITFGLAHERNNSAGRETRLEVLHSADLTANHSRK